MQLEDRGIIDDRRLAFRYLRTTEYFISSLNHYKQWDGPSPYIFLPIQLFSDKAYP